MGADLNRIRDIILEQQRRNEPYPDDPDQQITVTRMGVIQIGQGDRTVAVARLQQATFAAMTERMRRDMQVAREKLPPNTVFIDEPEARGWVYSIETELGETYQLFAYFSGSDYRVKLLAPPLEDRYDPHHAHLYSDGQLCLSEDPGYGQPSLEEAFSKSALWANGISFIKAGIPFPFSRNTAI